MASVSTLRPVSGVGDLRRLKARMQDLGLNFAVWDASGQMVEWYQTPWEARCNHWEPGDCCMEAASQLAFQVGKADQPLCRQDTCGCCLLAIPIRQRRRLVGAIVACQSGPSHVAHAHVTGPMLVYRGEDVLKILASMLEQEQSLDVAQNEIGTLSTNLATTYEELSLVYRISSSMKATQPPREFLENVCRELVQVMNVEAVAAVAFAHPSGGEDDEVVLAGTVDINSQQIRMLAATQTAPESTGLPRRTVINHFQAGPGSGLSPFIRSLISAPLISDGSPIGILIGINKCPGDFDSVDQKLISAIASQAAAFVTTSRLYTDLQDLLMGVLHALTASIDAKDPYTSGHSERVALICRKLAQACGYDAVKAQQVYLMGLLHDIGKIGVPEAVLCKPGRLTDEEFELIKKHPTIGAKILGGIRQLEDAVVGILTHHERLDGKGYPRRLAGDQVPMDGLIVGLADCFDAMTSSRTYRAALPLATVVQEIRQHSGTQFHPMLVEKFLAMDLEKFLEEIRQPARTVFPVLSRESLAGMCDTPVPPSAEGQAEKTQ